MKKLIFFSVLALYVLLMPACDKPSTSAPAAPVSLCKPLTETTNLSGNAAVYQYIYSADGNVSSISKFTNPSHVLLDSTAVFYDHTVTYSPGNIQGSFNTLATAYNANIFTGLPTEARQSITLNGITQVDYWVYVFSYDTKSRLIKVAESTPHITSDLEYDLNISYNDQDNVTALNYEPTTGPRTVTVVPASGYDDKPNPFAAIKNWPMLMHAGWGNSESEPVFTALSKNNLLGYTIPGWTKTISYTYNDKGQPLKRLSTNTTTTATYSFEEAFNYQCN